MLGELTTAHVVTYTFYVTYVYSCKLLSHIKNSTSEYDKLMLQYDTLEMKQNEDRCLRHRRKQERILPARRKTSCTRWIKKMRVLSFP